MIIGLAFVALPAKNPKRAGKFYRDLLGLKAGEWHVDAWVEVETPCGRAIALEHTEQPYLALESDDIVGDISRFRALGVEIVGDIRPSLAEVSNPDCCGAWIKDSEGNKVMIHQKRPSAGW